MYSVELQQVSTYKRASENFTKCMQSFLWCFGCLCRHLVDCFLNPDLWAVGCFWNKRFQTAPEGVISAAHGTISGTETSHCHNALAHVSVRNCKPHGHAFTCDLVSPWMPGCPCESQSSMIRRRVKIRKLRHKTPCRPQHPLARASRSPA